MSGFHEIELLDQEVAVRGVEFRGASICGIFHRGYAGGYFDPPEPAEFEDMAVCAEAGPSPTDRMNPVDLYDFMRDYEQVAAEDALLDSMDDGGDER